MAAGGVRRPPAGAELQRAAAHEVAALAGLAETEALEAEQHRRREIVVDPEAAEFVPPDSSTVVDALTGGQIRHPEVIRRAAAVVERILARIAGQQHWRLLQIP